MEWCLKVRARSFKLRDQVFEAKVEEFFSGLLDDDDEGAQSPAAAAADQPPAKRKRRRSSRQSPKMRSPSCAH